MAPPRWRMILSQPARGTALFRGTTTGTLSASRTRAARHRLCSIPRRLKLTMPFQALIDRSRAPLDLKTIKTILGYKHRPKNRRPTKRSAECEVAVERPTYDLTIFKLHCGKLTLKIYTKGERV